MKNDNTISVTNKSLAQHWDNAYKKSVLGWDEKNPTASLQLIEKCNFDFEARILNVGAGTSTLVDNLLSLGYKNLIVNDISSNALEILRQRIDTVENNVEWIIEDLTRPCLLKKLEKVDLWHDRAVLHFFTKQEDQNTYFDLLKNLVKKGGYAIIATFNISGALKCSSLPVFRYNKNMIVERMKGNFELIEHFNYNYINPKGDIRPYIYTLFKRIK